MSSRIMRYGWTLYLDKLDLSIRMLLQGVKRFGDRDGECIQRSTGICSLFVLIFLTASTYNLSECQARGLEID